MRSATLRGSIAGIVVMAVAVAALLLVPAASQAVTRRISGSCASGCRWRPAFRTVARGTKVVWRSADITHTVTSYRKTTGTHRGRRWHKNVRLGRGRSTSKIFRTRGLFRYKCTIHPGMVGSIRVR